MSRESQLALAFGHRPSLSGEDFLVAPCNAESVAWIDRWPDWPTPTLVIHGPPACGKTHLAEVFRACSGAHTIDLPAMRSENPVVFFENAPAATIEGGGTPLTPENEEAFLHFLNAARDAGRTILVTARLPVARWTVGLPDLRSRLMAAASVEIGAPDEALIGAVIVKQFRDRQIAVDAAVISYVVARIERSFAAVRRFVAHADETALSQGRGVTVPLARMVLDEMADGVGL